MKIYTKLGDYGQSELLGGMRLHKDADRFRALGELDEVSAWLGMLKCKVSGDEKAFIEQIQKDLIVLMSHCAALGGKEMDKYPFPAGLELEIEKRIDAIAGSWSGETCFDLPGVNEVSACAHIARTVVRRAERALCTIGWEYPLSVDALAYINRLSDYLFVLSVREAGGEGK
ncbi:MAG: ATP:cob(I)alamin adenosyltransferase [Defluviitaleaceae bacterium]|nr:ATP:cob(I)alamin adenosyltransferase [Defluviitaleaceae bacterium]MCL2835198.1 ATP:cob(I)alamin adenosyltransferase [Defluviitaleaceae bacterium]